MRVLMGVSPHSLGNPINWKPHVYGTCASPLLCLSPLAGEPNKLETDRGEQQPVRLVYSPLAGEPNKLETKAAPASAERLTVSPLAGEPNKLETWLQVVG